MGYRTVNGGIVITYKASVAPLLHRGFRFAREASDRIMTSPLVSAVAELSSKGTVRGAVTN